MSLTTYGEISCHQKCPSVYTEKSVLLGKCHDTHSEILTYGCTVCYLLICTECLRNPQSLKQLCYCNGEYEVRVILAIIRPQSWAITLRIGCVHSHKQGATSTDRISQTLRKNVRACPSAQVWSTCAYKFRGAGGCQENISHCKWPRTEVQSRWAGLSRIFMRY